MATTPQVPGYMSALQGTLAAAGNTPAYTPAALTGNTPLPAQTATVGGGSGTAQYQVSWSPNGAGGVNYFANGKPITNTQYGVLTGVNTGNLEATIASQFKGGGGNTNTAGSAGGGGGSVVNQAGLIEGLKQEYGGTIEGAHQLMAQNQANLPINEGGIFNQAAANANQIRANASGSLNTLGTQASGVQGQQKLSLAELADQIRGQNQALINDLGAVGAGFSSAVGQGQTALARVQNTGRADITQQAGTNLATISAEEQAVRDQQTTQLQALETWKQSQINAILQNYNQIQTQLGEQIQQAQGEQKARLATFGVNIQSAATDALTTLDGQVKQQVNGILNAERAIAAQQPNLTAAPAVAAAPTYKAPAALTVPTVSPFSGVGAGNASAPTLTGGGIAGLKQSLLPA